MREIKFRAWDKETNLMSWPFTLHETPTWELSGGGYTITDEDFKESPIMQYTGLKDKNGVEIYEGDVVKAWYDEGDSVDIQNCLITIDPREPTRGYWNECEVIGNIHQNPELL